MKCGGLDPRTHDVMKELARVQLYVKKFQTERNPKGLLLISYTHFLFLLFSFFIVSFDETVKPIRVRSGGKKASGGKKISHGKH